MNTNIVLSLLLMLATNSYALPAAYSSDSYSSSTLSERTEKPAHILERLGSLHQTVYHNNAPGIVLLALNGALIDEKNKAGKTPLLIAARLGHLHCIKQLLHFKANVNAQDRDGRTPLHLAILNKHQQCALTLIARGADVHAQERHGFTPLHCAAQIGSLDVITELLLYNADLNACTATGLTAKDIARNHQNFEVFAQLIPDASSDTGFEFFEKNKKKHKKRKEK